MSESEYIFLRKYGMGVKERKRNDSNISSEKRNENPLSEFRNGFGRAEFAAHVNYSKTFIIILCS